ncbi:MULTISPECIES: hypothetical protein [Streptomyces]|uniref:Uncharacterized protein n=1 Tax=Streptomyces buecherae TaxID=2763006 RepID=A0A7H8N4Z5_9ACTN|nr:MULTISPECIES: hypothetical protein [Streptomyces]MBC3981553.1 hypothetical protein [Streptomyces buecherae]MBC3989460.1 hypothetical protein [Streptomyces buecherae]QKW49530.1 hypothetical protein HUT08_08140 [Streptomyces buecherae]QNJ42855.1 hypothetical protein H7H31_26505 [Streptomyces buecherae]WEV28207.1 hypothetical protein OYE22_25790 [Streptomyces sp. 71268]
MAVAATPLPYLPDLPSFPTLPKKRVPAGHPREWYESHHRRLKAMRLAIALLHAGVYRPEQASNRKIRTTAARIGVHPPSDTTCRMVRSLIHYDD